MMQCIHVDSRKRRVALIGSKISYVNMCFKCYMKYISNNGFSGSCTPNETEDDNYYMNNCNDNAAKNYENKLNKK